MQSRSISFLTKILFISLFLFSHELFSQSANKATSIITGWVVEADRPLEYASVVLKSQDNAIITGGLTNNLGQFSLRAGAAGQYVLEVSSIGYQTKRLEIAVKEGTNTLSDPIMINESVNILKEATITVSHNEKQTDIEKTKINPSASIAGTRGSVTDLLRTSSMISIDNNNSVSIRGNSKILILIDGIPSTIGSLDGVPASIAQSIEIITNPDARYDSEGTGGIINIITKKERKDGFSITSSINWGLYERVNGDANLQFSAGKWNIGTGYSGKYHLEEVRSELTRFFYSTSNSIEQKIDSRQNQKSGTYTINAGRKYTDGSQLNLNFKYFNPEINNHQKILNTSTYATNTLSVNRLNDFNHIRDMGEIIVDFKKILKKEISNISFRASFSRTKGQRPASYYEDNLFVMRALGGGYPTNYSFQTDYTSKISKKVLLETGFRFFHRGNSFKFDTYQYDTLSAEWFFNPFFSADLTHGEDIGALYFNLSGKLKDNITYKFGMRAEYGMSELRIIKENEEISSDNLFLAPFILFKREINEQSSLSFNLSRRITRPSYIQINPYVNMMDKSIYETGNRHIKPEQVTKVELMYNFSKNGTSFNSSIYYSKFSDFIAQISSLYGDDALMLTYVNVEKSNRAGADINFRHKFSNVINVNSGISVFYGETKGLYNGIDLSSSSTMWSGNIALNVIPDKRSDIAIQYFYSSPATFPQFKTRSVHFMDIAVRRTLIKDRLNASLTLSDVFNTRRWDINSDNPIYRLSNNSKNQSRVLWLGLTFNLNMIQQSKSQKKDDEIEQQSLIRIGY